MPGSPLASDLAAARAALEQLAVLVADHLTVLDAAPLTDDAADRLLASFDDTAGAVRFWLETLSGRWG